MNKSVLIFLLFISIQPYAQDMKANDYQKLGRDSLIKLATEKIKSTVSADFNPNDYPVIKTFRREDMVFVVFHNPIQYIPQKGAFIYSITMTLTDGALSYSELSTDNTANEAVRFFKSTKESNKAVDFVFKSINKSQEVGHVKKEDWPLDVTMTIRDKGSYYEIEVDDEYTNSDYKIKKSNGKIYDASHKHYARDPDQEPVIEIIK